MRELEDIRKDITSVDKQMTELFEKRMHLASEVAEYKKAHGLPIFDATREAKVLECVSSNVKDGSLGQYAVKFFQNLMEVSKELQKTLYK
ncbi:MAG: chorismate mutase [Paludibacteraceae bacterium]|nr:chorismate mutase [Paludibacteraceae bacterium]